MTNYSSILTSTVSFSEFNQGQAEKIFDKVRNTGTMVVVKNDKPECILISINNYMQMVEEINDTKALLMAMDRMNEFSDDIKNAFNQQEIEKMFDVNSNDYDEVEIE